MYIIGTSEDSDIKIDEDESISAHHARIFYENGNIFVENLSPDSGTFINGFRINKKMSLNRGDCIAIGDKEFVLR